MHSRIGFALIAGVAVSGLFSACAQGPASRQVSLDAVQDYIDRYIEKQTIPFWKQQREGLAQTMATPSPPDYLAAWKELNKAERTQSTADLVGVAMGGITGHERNARLVWLRWKILNGNADSRYSYTYAALLAISRNAGSATPLLQEAATFLFQARIALAIDGARCADRASLSIGQRSVESLPMMAPVIDYIATAPASEIGDALTNALAIERWRESRPPQAWLCALGAATALKAISNDSSAMKNEGTHITIDTSRVTPDYVQEELWRQRKNEILNEQLRILANYVQNSIRLSSPGK